MRGRTQARAAAHRPMRSGSARDAVSLVVAAARPFPDPVRLARERGRSETSSLDRLAPKAEGRRSWLLWRRGRSRGERVWAAERSMGSR